ncbi:ylmG homolog protein 1-2, chloroplastic [Carica papaya]|uniref:ylmG homolog protein 1-2, chloroplastic n=1 Tax=Carica papaya TaxID=3649 RepID=UPI000B8CBBAC|nr:ylmG homolog protein 1-2, chloroplastic [Carica papaya]
MALITQILNFRAPVLLPPQPRNPRIHLINRKFNGIPSLPKTPYLSLYRKNPRIIPLATASASASASASKTLPSLSQKISSLSPLVDSTRTITTLVTLAFAVFAKLAQNLSFSILNPNTIGLSLQSSVVQTVGPAFFASLRDRPSGYLNTPLTVVAAGLSKWLDIYSGVLMVRVLLSWFPNIPWDRQPLSAIRDLCDPYLNLFRNIIPPVFDTLDVSPLLAFAVLGTLGSILNNSRGMY